MDKWRVHVALVWAPLMCAACSSSRTLTTPEASEAGVHDASRKPTAEQTADLLQTLKRSREAWDALVAAMGDTYSYAEENCLVNAAGPSQAVTTIQVEGGAARLFATTLIDGSMCESLVNRYNDFTPRTLPELYAECEALVRAEGRAVTLQVDQRGVLKACIYPGDSDCFDNCGEGFYLRALQFGALEVP
jgi:hypothetical protein